MKPIHTDLFIYLFFYDGFYQLLYHGMPLPDPRVAVVAEDSYSRARREAAVVDESQVSALREPDPVGDGGHAKTSRTPGDVSKLTYKQPRVVGLYRGQENTSVLALSSRT
jgi:hypothetical protein